MKNKITKRWIVTGLIAIAALVLIANAFKIVPTGYTGVRVRLGQVSEQNIPSGIAFEIPFVDNIRLVNNKQQDITIDGQIWSETSERTALYYEGINITYRINSGRSAWLVANVNDYEHTLLTSSFVSSSVKTASKQFSAIDATNRGIIEPAIAQALQASVDEKYGEDTITIIKVVVNNADYEDSYNQVIAEQQAAQIRYQTQQIENQRSIEQAEAQATVTRTSAQAEADALLIAAEAEAEANSIREESLTPNIIRYETISRWDGRLPMIQTGEDGGIIPMIDMSEMYDEASSGPAPAPAAADTTEEG
ncbi:MAG: hypothetical protein K6C38_05975 [Saccharofermentans sp.]|jgi:regulator of protease activity HflC (stomatin/prohibitin superfamily)|nr:hypothetical protein [Saccharofermentans sp.]